MSDDDKKLIKLMPLEVFEKLGKDSQREILEHFPHTTLSNDSFLCAMVDDPAPQHAQ